MDSMKVKWVMNYHKSSKENHQKGLCDRVHDFFKAYAEVKLELTAIIRFFLSGII